jgi:hypothetical protein
MSGLIFLIGSPVAKSLGPPKTTFFQIEIYGAAF